jgi:hypothetical protein
MDEIRKEVKALDQSHPQYIYTLSSDTGDYYHDQGIFRSLDLPEADIIELYRGSITEFALLRVMQRAMKQGGRIPVGFTANQNVLPEGLTLFASELNLLLEAGTLLASIHQRNKEREQG